MAAGRVKAINVFANTVVVQTPWHYEQCGTEVQQEIDDAMHSWSVLTDANGGFYQKLDVGKAKNEADLDVDMLLAAQPKTMMVNGAAQLIDPAWSEVRTVRCHLGLRRGGWRGGRRSATCMSSTRTWCCPGTRRGWWTAACGSRPSSGASSHSSWRRSRACGSSVAASRG